MELLNGTESNKDGPPEKVVTDEVEIVTLSIPKLFEKQTCDILQLHEYQNAARLTERERERQKERERERGASICCCYWAFRDVE